MTATRTVDAPAASPTPPNERALLREQAWLTPLSARLSGGVELILALMRPHLSDEAMAGFTGQE